MRYLPALLLLPCAWAQEVIIQQSVGGPVMPAGPAAPLDPNAKPGAIEGKVIHSITGEPVRKVNLTLRGNRPELGAGSALSTDAEGKFRFENVMPGAYTLFAEKTGFIRQPYNARKVATMMGGTPLNITSGQEIKNLEFALTPQGLISGKVIDEDGEPVARVSVTPYKLGGQRNMMAGMQMTNDIGEFRIGNLPAGKYLLRAQRMGDFMGSDPVPNKEDKIEEGYVPTFYPGVTEESQAAPIEVAVGQEVNGTQIQLRKSRVFRIRGRISGGDSSIFAGQQRPRIMIQPRERRQGMVMMMGGPGAQVKPDGTFELASVAPGSYNINVMSFGAGPGGAIGRAAVDITNQNLNDVVIHIGGMVTVTGVVKVEGNDKYKVQSTVRLAPEGGMSFGNTSGPVREENAFKIENLSRDKYFVQLMPPPEGMYVKDVKYAGTSVRDDGIDLTAAAGEAAVEILLSPKAGSVDGTVLDGDKPFSGGGVVLVPDPFTGKNLIVTAKTTSTDQNGKFSLKGIAPGDYTLYAIEEPTNPMFLDAELLKPYEKSSKKVKIGESGRESAELRISKAN